MDMQEWSKFAAEFNSRMNSPGLFLNSAAGGKTDTMTIGWGSAGVFWGKPVLTVAVRYSRYTRELIEQSGFFTVSIPKRGGLTEALAVCGSKSGRDVDKFAACGLTAKPGRKVPVPVIGEAQAHIECRVLYKTDMGRLNFDAALDARFYADHNYHTLYFGEVVDSYGL
jgi:flavin reductase (DIM6/NTAB) family NADH-FMN oxidoreductase RutF